LAVDGLQAGSLLGAIADPIAADVSLVPSALGFGALPLLEAGAIDTGEFKSLIP
jgi:hypothetical protein